MPQETDVKKNQSKQIGIEKILTTADISLLPIKAKFTIKVLNMVIAFLYKPSSLRTRKTLNNLKLLFNRIDLGMYEKNNECLDRIWFIKETLSARLDESFEDDEWIKEYCMEKASDDEMKKEIIQQSVNYTINYDESTQLIRKMEDALRYGYIMTIKEIWQDYIDDVSDDRAESISFRKNFNSICKMSSTILNIQRATSSVNNDHRFSLVKEQLDQIIEESIDELTDRNRIFTTGIQRWNTFLSPGYMNKRLYIYLAFPGKGKSTILLKSALDIKKYNPNIETKNPNKRPAVVFLTLENSIAETVERMFNMQVCPDDIRNFRKSQVKKQMREAGFTLTEKNNIDLIFLEYKNREIDTNDIYTILQDLSDEGIETIALIVDYIKRLRPYEKAMSEKEELKNISNELKEIAKSFDIPVITAQQLNRSSASVVDAALQNNKEDVTRLVGRDGVSGAWEIIENGDFVCIINPEKKADTGETYLTFKLLKRRYRSSEEDEELRRFDYFNHPFEKGNEIKLIDDVDMDKPLSLTSLSTKFSPVDDGRGKENAIERKKIEPKKKKSVFDEFDDFDRDQAENL